MITFTCLLAEVSVEASVQFASTRDYCKDYLTDTPAQVSVRVTPEDILAEREISKRASKVDQSVQDSYTDQYLEKLALYRKIVGALLEKDILLFHSSVISLDGDGYLFTAPSGTGKSTHARLWREHFGDRVVVVNDDKPLLKVTPQQVVAYGTPWNGKHKLGSNTSCELKSICLIEQSPTNQIERLPVSAAFQVAMRQIYLPTDKDSMTKALGLIKTVLEKVPVFKLGCNISEEAVLVAYEGMNE